ncbi:MAG TPA: selenocysteine-specific translation elongation factor [Tepidisphaeraceae bacterium]|nr:selenocysteine-specific translation elongation factor [Tepidisphaeraceae bacterium]
MSADPGSRRGRRISTRSYILATAGHVDHGKSALVHALTGTDPDRLPEEKARGITIDLGFAHLTLAGPSADSASASLHLGIVDVPGHEDFVKNMVAGVGSIDLALLVVAADDGWMPQTEEHLQILQYLGVTRAVVALTKIDLVASEDAAGRGVRDKLAGTAFADATVVATSVHSGRGLEELKKALAAALADAPSQRDVGKPRLPLDRVFSLHGAGTIVTGTLIGGSLRRGQELVVQPSGAAARVRAIQTHNHDVESIVPGCRVALNLPDLRIARRGGAREAGSVGRGDVITVAGLWSPGETLDVILERSGRAIDGTGLPRPLRDGTRLRIHHGSANCAARLLLLNRRELAPGGRAYAQLRLETPMFTFAGDRFILRDWSEQHTLAGGTILGPDASRENARGDDRLAYLQAMDRAQGNAGASILAHVGRVRVAGLPTLLLQSQFSGSQVSQTVEHLAAMGSIVRAGDSIVEPGWWNDLRQRAINAIDAGHKAHPERDGLPLADLRATPEAELPEVADVFDALVAELARDAFARTGAAIYRRSHRAALPPRLQPSGARIVAALNARPWDPPSRKELTLDDASFQAMKFLINSGEVIAVGNELVLAAEHYGQAVQAIRRHLQSRGPSTVSDLRQVLNSTRRVMIPLLEKLDREGITARQGDKRVAATK